MILEKEKKEEIIEDKNSKEKLQDQKNNENANKKSNTSKNNTNQSNKNNNQNKKAKQNKQNETNPNKSEPKSTNSPSTVKQATSNTINLTKPKTANTTPVTKQDILNEAKETVTLNLNELVKNKPDQTVQKNNNTNNQKDLNKANKSKKFTVQKTEKSRKISDKPQHIIMPFISFIAIFVCLIIAIFGGFTIYNYKHNTTISKGLYINNIDISGLTKQEAQVQIEKYYSDILSNDITLLCNDYTTYIKTSEIDLSFDIESAVNYAYNIGKGGNIFVDNFQIFNAMVNGINVMPNAKFNEEKLTNILNNLSSELPNAVVESGYYIEDNELIITKGKDGYVINADSTMEKIAEKITNLSYLNETIQIDLTAKSPKKIDLNAIYSEIHKEPKNAYFTTEPHAVYPSENGIDFKISLEEAQKKLQTADYECTIPLKVLYPSVTTNMIGQEAFPDKLSSFSTKYAASNTNRTTNLRLAAGKINGYVLLPGETFSYNSVVGERTIAAGYKDAAIYSEGKVVDGLGGGICQISTTLFNAALYANLQMVELSNHMFVPSYVGAGRDATVVYGVIDFKFKNTRNHAIKINCSVSNGIASFEMWGVKEPVEYDVGVYSTINSQTSSYIKSSTYRTLKQNGQLIKTENIANFTYRKH